MAHESNAQRSLDELKHLIRTCPVIDNHAHNILRPQQLKSANFLTITTEASGEALEDTPKSLSHLRAARQLRELYGLRPEADWAAILGKRTELLERDADSLMKNCFEGTETILVDDGLDSGANIQPYNWHDKFTASPCKRIVRIETVAASILSNLHQQGKLPVGVAIADEEACSLAWVTFIAAFEQAFIAGLEDDEVVGFKSVICYRTGLDIQVGRDIDVSQDGLHSFRRHFLPECVVRKFRVEAKGMNDALVVSACKLIAAHDVQKGVAKPIQFHTGLGDNDISLVDSNPAYMQPLIKAFPTVPIVLLHSAYPYTREAGYLATVYKNVYLDIGEVFPMVNRDGQEKIVRQALELTPTSKVLWSTDGHHFPETYWLANVQGRKAMEKVLVEYVQAEDLTVEEAVRAAKDILFENSNVLYGLGLQLVKVEESMGQDTAGADKDHFLMHSTDPVSTTPSPARSKDSLYDNTILPRFCDQNPQVDIVMVQWPDWLGWLRSRCLPIKSFANMVKQGNRIGISEGNLGTTQNDNMSSTCNPVGQVMVEPDLHSLRMMQTQLTHVTAQSYPPTATVMAGFTDEKGRPLDLCPRSQLAKSVNALQKEFGVDLLVGFEIEITFVRNIGRGSATEDNNMFAPLDINHAWGTLSDEQLTKSFPLIAGIALALQKIGIELQQFHSEAGAGQYEYVLPPLPPVQAVDTLVQTRQCIQQIAASQGLRATCHPMPFPGIGTAAHAHISLNSSSGKPREGLDEREMSFMAEVLKHLPALCAFTMPQPVSYGRVVDDSWSGGTFVAWGTQNRETPLRRVLALSEAKGNGNRWEVRCLDGLANMYLAMAAIVSAGLAGIRSGAEMVLKDCTRNPTKLTAEERQELGITKRLPTSFTQAIRNLEEDAGLAQTLPLGFVHHYLEMKKAEQEMLQELPERDRRVWLMERY